MKVGVDMTKPVIMREQMVKSSEASKKFGYIRKKAKVLPQFITENGTVDSVLMNYEYYEKMYQRLVDLEEKDEAGILLQRIERLEKDPTVAIPWRQARCSGNINDCSEKI